MLERHGEIFELLLVEDNEADLELVRQLLSSKKSLKLHCAMNGEEAFDFLFKKNKYAKDLSVPDLILLDLNVPRMDGRSLLKEIKNDKGLCKIPVIILSTSSSDREVSEAYSLGASAFISKPINLSDFQLLLERMVDFYFGGVRLATRPGRKV